jgi:hypothetical protein
MTNPRYGYVLTTDDEGRVIWSSINENNILPSQSGKADYVLSTTGSGIYWRLPSASISIANTTANQTFYPVLSSGDGSTTGVYVRSSPYAFSFNPNQNRLYTENATVNTITVGSGNSGGIGQLSWNPDDGTLDLGLLGGNSTLQVGQELMIRVFNDENNQINDGQVVSINGAQGQRLAILRAVASGAYSAAHAIGIATENIPSKQLGFITVFGVVRNLNTYIDGSSEGREIFLSPTTPGDWTVTRPSAPNHAVSVGFIQREHPNAGSIFVRVQTGDHLEYLHDVLLTSPASGDIIRYDSSNQVWKNSPLPSGGIYTAGSGLILEGSQFRVHGTGQLSELRLRANASNYTAIIASGLNTNLTFILPSGYGSNNQVLKTNGAGVLDWTTVSTGSTYTAGSGLTLVGSEFNLAGTGVLDKLTVTNKQSSNIPFIVRSAAAQSANIQEWQNSALGVLASVDKDGNFSNSATGAFNFVQLNSTLAAQSGILFVNNSKIVSTAPNLIFNNSNLASPKLTFRASGTITPDISLNILTTASGSTSGVQTLSFEGSAGQLFSITDVLNSGTIFSVNDISGLPLIEADASGLVRLARFGTDVEVYAPLELMPTGTTSGRTNELRFYELAASGSNYVGFRSPDSLAANRIWVLPTGDGSASQALTTNGAGVLSWSTPSGTTYTAGSGLALTGTQFSLGGTGNIRQLRFLSSGNANYISFTSPALSGITNYILPTGDGTSGQALLTNGSATLSWGLPVPTSGTATALNSVAITTNANFYPVLSSGTGPNASSIDLALTYNPSTDMLTASGITATRFAGHPSSIITESTTSRTLQAGDNGGVIMCTNNSGATLTVPTGLPVGFSVGVMAAATGVVSFTTSGTTLNHRQSHTKLAGQWAMGTVIQRTTNNFVLAGDTA